MSASPRREPADSRLGHVTAARAATVHCLPPTPIAARRAAEKKRPLLERIRQVLSLWRRRQRDRAALRALSPRQLSDFCPRQAEAEAEMHKPFWRA